MGYNETPSERVPVPEIVDFVYESASCKIIDWEDGTASVTSVYSAIKGQGHATEMLMRVTRWADDYGVLLKLIAEAHGPDPKLPQSKLIEFYKKFGFEPDEDADEFVYMERETR